MRREIRETDTLALWCRPGAVPGWVSWLVGVAAIVTLALAIIGPRFLWEYAGVELEYSPIFDRVIAYTAFDRWWFCSGLAIGFAIWIAASYALRSRLSRVLQVGVLLPIGYAIALVVVWLVWPALAMRMPSIARQSPLVFLAPMGWIAAIAGAACALGGWLAARRRRDWVHAATMIALVQLLLVGLWLPIASTVRRDWVDIIAEAPWRIVVWVVVPPFTAAVGYVALASRRPELARQLRPLVVGCLLLMFAIALVARLEPNARAAVIYANFIHVLIALAAVALAAIVALAASLRIGAWRMRRAFAADRARVSGVIAPDAGIVGRTEITSWLRGPRTVLGPFTIATPAGALVVPGGAELVAPLPEITTQLTVGESIPVLRAGDRIEIAGFVAPAATHPVRDSAALVPGGGRLFVAPRDRPRAGLVDVALAVWRPCVTALAILMTVSVVGLAGTIPSPAVGSDLRPRHHAELGDKPDHIVALPEEPPSRDDGAQYSGGR